MSRTAQYKTKQKEEMLRFLKSMSGEKITVNDIVKHFTESGVTLGTATIYRHLERMVADGDVKKYFVDGMASACFEYVGDDTGDGKNRFYLKCERCGKLIRFHCRELQNIQNHLLMEHGFSIDSARTVFYGTCNQCTLSKI